MLKLKYILIALLSVAVLAMSIRIYKSISARAKILSNNQNLSQSIREMDLADGITAHLNDITPFEWDTLYVFTPYYPKSEIEDIIGIRSGQIRSTVSDEQQQIVFIYGDQIVSSISNPIILGFQFTRNHVSGYGYVTLHAADDPILEIDISGKDITTFTFIDSSRPLLD